MSEEREPVPPCYRARVTLLPANGDGRAHANTSWSGQAPVGTDNFQRVKRVDFWIAPGDVDRWPPDFDELERVLHLPGSWSLRRIDRILAGTQLEPPHRTLDLTVVVEDLAWKTPQPVGPSTMIEVEPAAELVLNVKDPLRANLHKFLAFALNPRAPIKGADDVHKRLDTLLTSFAVARARFNPAEVASDLARRAFANDDEVTSRARLELMIRKALEDVLTGVVLSYEVEQATRPRLGRWCGSCGMLRDSGWTSCIHCGANYK